MQDFWFYIMLGLNHVLDFRAYDHILFLSALTIPFTFKHWRKVVVLATLFTVAHCFSLALSAYNILSVATGLIEFLIPITILLTALFNAFYVHRNSDSIGMYLHGLVTTFFGLIHGFGFSNYFNMLMAEEEQIMRPLLGFATGIEISQVLIILCILVLVFLLVSLLQVKRSIFILTASTIIALITIPMLIKTFPW